MLVRVPEISVDLYFANRDNLADAVDQLWIVLGDHESKLPISAGDAAVIEELFRRYRPQRDAIAEQAAAARDRGDATFTVEVDLPEEAAEDIDYLARLLGRIDQLCAEQALALPAPPEVRAFRAALFGAIAGQLHASS